MRKILAFILCFFLSFSLGLYFTPHSFNLLIGWLSPLFGTSLHVLLSMIFLLFGDPFKFMTLISVWTLVGIICGIIVRRRVGSFFSAWTVYGALFSVVIIAVLRIVEIATELGLIENPRQILTILPPLPPGASLGIILSAPIIGEIYESMQGISFSSFSSPMEIALPILGTIGLNIAKNLVILFVSSLIGCEIGKAIEKLLTRKTRSSQTSNLKAEIHAGTVRITRKVVKLVLAFLPLVILVSSSFILTSAEINQENSYYAEGAFVFATPDGTAYLASAFVDSEMSLNGIDLTRPEFQDALLGVLICHDTSAATLPPILTSPMLLGVLPSRVPSETLQNMMRYYEMIPRTVFVIVYIGIDADTARERADVAAADFSSAFDTSLDYLIMFSKDVRIEEENRAVTFLVYHAITTLEEIGQNMMNSLPTNRKGLAASIDSAYEAGIFTPHSTSISANGTVIAVGFFSSPMISSIIEDIGSGPHEIIRFVLPNTTRPTPMIGLFSYWINRLHSSPFNQTLSINDLLNITDPIEFSPEADISIIAAILPNVTIQDGQIISQTPIVSIITSANLSSSEFEPFQLVVQKLSKIVNVEINEIPPGATLPSEILTVNFMQVFPLNLKVEKEVSAYEVDIGQRIEVTIKVTNYDSDPALNVVLNDSLVRDYYGPRVLEVIGNLTKEWTQIPGNSSKIHTYSIMLKNEGIYTLPSAEVTYKFANQTFTRKSNEVYVTVRTPQLSSLLLTGIPEAWNTLVRMIDKIPRLQGKGSLILSSSTLIIAGLIAFNEYRNIKRWLRTRG